MRAVAPEALAATLAATVAESLAESMAASPAESMAESLAGAVADSAGPGSGRLRVAIDGAPCTGPDELAEAVADALGVLGRPAVSVRANMFWRDASLRLEYGHTDIDSYLHDWLDVGALIREVLDPFGPDGSGEYVASLRDPVTNRATREPRRSAPPGAVVLVSGELLLGRGLPFDHTIHLTVSMAALHRRTVPELAWTLPAFERYDVHTRPAELADTVVRLEHPGRPAISLAARRPTSDR